MREVRRNLLPPGPRGIGVGICDYEAVPKPFGDSSPPCLSISLSGTCDSCYSTRERDRYFSGDCFFPSGMKPGALCGCVAGRCIFFRAAADRRQSGGNYSGVARLRARVELRHGTNARSSITMSTGYVSVGDGRDQ
jgi:hypothetical protein